MRLHRFFITQPLGEEIVINNKELLKQWFQVFRYKVGDSVILFNGNGNESLYSIFSYDKTRAILRFLHTQPSYVPEKDVTLLLSLTKKDTLEVVVQKGTELGVSSFILFTSSRSEKKNIDLKRLERIAVEASEQCGRGNIPTIQGVFDLPSALLLASYKTKTLVLDKEGAPISLLPEAMRDVTQAVSLCIGPEGGWTDKEYELFEEKGLLKVQLTKTTLRAETAAIVGAYTLLQE